VYFYNNWDVPTPSKIDVNLTSTVHLILVECHSIHLRASGQSMNKGYMPHHFGVLYSILPRNVSNCGGRIITNQYIDNYQVVFLI
jgi:hypothetical protein